MGFISKKSSNTPHSVIREMFAMQTGLTDVVSFALGEPDFNTPKHIVEATIDSFKRGETRYAPNGGIPALKEVVAKSYKARGLNYTPKEIVIGAGAISLLNLALTAVLDLGDEIIIADPGWANYKGLAMQVGAVPIAVKVSEENDFMYDIASLSKVLTKKTKAILLNSPSNPTGGVASHKNLELLAKFVVENDLYVITDEIYRELLYTDEPYVSIASMPGMKERTIIVDGFSKTYAMTGFRLGYAAAPEQVIAVMTKLLENVLSSVNECVQWGGVAALQGNQECVEMMREKYRTRRNLMVEALNNIPGITCREPKGAFYAFPNISALGIPCREFAIRLLQKKHVVVVPGTGFGEGGTGFIRLSYATSEEKISEGMNRMKAFVESL